MNATPTMLTARLHAALDYADRGWHVFPLVPGTKRPATPGHRGRDCDGTDPRCRHGHTGWEQRATTDADRIRRAWSVNPYGIGIACGPSGLLVIDTDTAKPADPIPAAWQGRGVNTGESVLAELAAEHRASLPPTWTVTTPSGGIHRYYATGSTTQRGPVLGNSAGLLGWLIDTRGVGGYVVAPPTRTDDGEYLFTEPHAVAPLPAWLLPLLTRHTPRPTHRSPAPVGTTNPSGYVRAAIDGETSKVAAAMPGQRNHALYCAAIALGQLVAGGALAEATAADELHRAAAVHVAAGAFTDAEADATIRSGFRAGARSPRTAA